MDLFDLATTRLSTQKLVASKAKTAKDVVASMGAMQAQDFAMAKWAVGIYWHLEKNF